MELGGVAYRLKHVLGDLLFGALLAADEAPYPSWLAALWTTCGRR